MRAVAKHEFVVRCTPEEAFDYLSDIRNELHWNPQTCQSVEMVTEDPIGEGTRFRAKWKGSPELEVEITHFERPHIWRAHTAGSMESNFEGAVEPHPDGATVRTELEMIPHGWMKLFFPIFKLIFTRAEANVPKQIQEAMMERYGDSPAAA